MKKRILVHKDLLKKYFLAIIIGVVFLFGVYFYKTTSRFHENEREPGIITPEADKMFDEKCNLMEKIVVVPSPEFEIVEYRCSEEQEFKHKIPEGQEMVVDIFTNDFNAGKDIFRQWLDSQGLKESDKLRVTYAHKPQ